MQSVAAISLALVPECVLALRTRRVPRRRHGRHLNHYPHLCCRQDRDPLDSTSSRESAGSSNTKVERVIEMIRIHSFYNVVTARCSYQCKVWIELSTFSSLTVDNRRKVLDFAGKVAHGNAHHYAYNS